MFFEDPSLSINDVAAVLDKKHIGLRRDDLSRIRQEVRGKVAAGGNNPNSPVLAVSPQTAQRIQPLIRRHGNPPPPPTPMPSVTVKTVQPSEPFNPPRIETPKATDIMNVASTTLAGQDTKQEEVSVHKHATQEERLKWLEDWLLDNVEEASVGKARVAMLKKFGAGYAFGSQKINILLKQALEAAGLKPRLGMRAGKGGGAAQMVASTPERREVVAPVANKVNVTPIRKGSPSMQEAASSIGMLMRAAGIEKVELDGDNIKVTRTQPMEFSFKVT